MSKNLFGIVCVLALFAACKEKEESHEDVTVASSTVEVASSSSGGGATATVASGGGVGGVARQWQERDVLLHPLAGGDRHLESLGCEPREKDPHRHGADRHGREAEISVGI